MNRQRIRINEAQLKQIVTESVKKVLNELDWKTYTNAAMKCAEFNPYEQPNLSFKDVWSILREPEEASKKYGANVVKKVLDDFDEYDKRQLRSKKFFDAADKAYTSQLLPQGMKTHTPSFFYQIKTSPDDPDDSNWEDEWYVNWQDREDTPSEEEFRIAGKAQDEIKDFLKGKYKYQKGKG